MDKNEKIVLYTKPDGTTEINVRLEGDTIRLNQNQISELFDVDRTVVVKHLRNIFKEGELNEFSTCAKFTQVQYEGERQVKRTVNFYNLDAIISVGYRVNSKNATAFRIRATSILKDYLIK